MKRKGKNKQIGPEELAQMADSGEDVTPYLGRPEKGHFAKMLKEKNIKRTTIDFGIDMLKDLDLIASRLNISRQAVVKMALQDYLIKYKLASKEG